VSGSRAALILVAVLALSGCGASKSTETTTGTQAGTPPAVRAVDEPATVPPPGSMPMMCPDRPVPCEPTPAEAGKVEQAVKQATAPHAIAELRLSARGPNARARLIAWRNRSGKLCLETQVDPASSAAFGPCLPGPPCRKICVQLLQTRTDSAALYLLGGVVASENDRLQLTTDDGRVETFGLSGPVVPGFPGYRVFMLDLGRGLYRRLELLDHDQVVGEETLTPAEIRSLRCNESTPVLPSQRSQSQRSPLQKCVQRATPK
jgi:hypothetical protein